MTPHDELMALAGEAAGGEWCATEVVPGHAEIGCGRRGESVNTQSPANAAFIAAACNFVRSDAFRAMVRDVWLPIESAPKDGTRVLLSIKWSDVPVVGEFSNGRWWFDTEHYEVNCGTYCYGGSACGDRGAEPTHWRPLPAPPQAIDAAASGAGE